MFYYAQLDLIGFCIGVSCLSGEVENDKLVQIENYDVNYINRKYDLINKVWTNEYRQSEELFEPSTKEEILQLQAAVIDLQYKNREKEVEAI